MQLIQGRIRISNFDWIICDDVMLESHRGTIFDYFKFTAVAIHGPPYLYTRRRPTATFGYAEAKADD